MTYFYIFFSALNLIYCIYVTFITTKTIVIVFVISSNGIPYLNNSFAVL